MLERICFIGIGLIGGSLALALRKAGFARELVGFDQSQTALENALKLNVIDRYETDIAQAISGCQLVFIAVPLGANYPVLLALRNYLPADCIVTDAGSVKQSVLSDVKSVFGELPENFVAGHPIAGTEQSGVQAAFAELFKMRNVVLTPHERNHASAVAMVRKMWEAAGAVVEFTDAQHHDKVLALTSHLPHVLAYGLVDSLARKENVEEIFRFAAGGFRDFTRIAASDPLMWRDICLHNREQILQAMESYRLDLDELTRAIDRQDADTLYSIFFRAKKARDQFSYL